MKNEDASSPLSSSDVTTTGGTVNKIPLFTTATNIQNSILTQTGNHGGECGRESERDRNSHG